MRRLHSPLLVLSLVAMPSYSLWSSTGDRTAWYWWRIKATTVWALSIPSPEASGGDTRGWRNWARSNGVARRKLAYVPI